jgi:TPR repeat protein
VSATSYHKACADRGHPRGMLLHSDSSEKAESVERDLALAARYLKLFLAQVDSPDMQKYGLTIEQSRKVELCSQWYKLAAALGDPEAMRMYGIWLGVGQGVERDCATAARYFTMAADLGDAVGTRG